MGIPDHLTCLLRNLYRGQEATVRTGHGTTDWFQIGKGVHQGCILLLVLYWTGTWWSGVDNERVKEGKRLIVPALRSRLSRSRESARNREREKKKKRERKKERKTQESKLWWSKHVLSNFVRVYIPVASLDKDQETRLYKFTKEVRSNRAHKAKRWSIRGLKITPFTKWKS